jgi:class 3 adenylate cyclase
MGADGERKPATLTRASRIEEHVLETQAEPRTAAPCQHPAAQRPTMGGFALRRHSRQVHRRRHHGRVRCARPARGPPVRACLAALGVQEEAARLAVEVNRRDGVELQLRIGLNSGQVIAGEIGSGPFGYTAIGEQVGMAQRMGSVARPSG